MMWWFTLFFGFFGLHHLLLRSPQTALLTLIANCVTLGYVYFYDLIQLSDSGGLKTEGLNSFGLGSPLGPLGVAQGMWIPDGEKPKESEDDPPNPWWFFLYSLFLPIAPLAQAIAGDTNNAIGRLLYFFVIPFGWLLLGISIVYDAWILLFQPGDLSLFGSKRIFPFPSFGWHKEGHSPNLTAIDFEPDDCSESFVYGLWRAVLESSLSVLRFVNPALALTIQQALLSPKVATDILDGAKGVIEKGGETAATVLSTAGNIIDKSANTLGKVAKLTSTLSSVPLAVAPLPSAPPSSYGFAMPPPLPSAPPAPAPNTNEPTDPSYYSGMAKYLPSSTGQSGGGPGKDKGQETLTYFTIGTLAAVIGGGFLLTAGRTLSENARKSDDSPPNPGTV